MNDHIVCPHCSRSFPATQVFSHQLEAERKRITREIEESTRKKIERDLELKMKDTKNESEELKKQNSQLQEQILETNKLIRSLRTQLEQKELEVQKKLDEEIAKAKEDASKKAEEENRMANLEIKKKLDDALKANDDLRRKLQQGSQQTQGEVLEEYLENTLRTTFLNDVIEPVPKGIRGADIIQTVRNNYGSGAGSIIWESKRTKAWSGDWVAKLKADKRAVNADVAIIVSHVLPEGVKNFGYYQGVWVCNYESIMGAATSVRTLLLSVAAAKSSTTNVEEKKDALFEYIQSTEFKNRVEAISEAFRSRQDEIEVEKRWFTKKWAREEKTIRSLIDTNQVLRGELEAIIGKTIASDRELELPEAPTKDNGDLFT